MDRSDHFDLTRREFTAVGTASALLTKVSFTARWIS